MESYRPPYRAALGAGATVFALYVLTLAPTTSFWDAGEYIATGYTLGIPHPPGNPLFVTLARVWSILLAPLGLPVAVRINLLAAATSAGAAAMYFLVAHRVLTGLFRDQRLPLAGAAVAVLIGATTFTVWNQSTVNEKVYTVSVLVIAAVTWLALRWRDRRHEPGSERYLLLALYLMVLGSTNHLMSVLPLPALGIMVLLTAPAVLLRPRLWAAALPLTALALSMNFFLPLRAAERPVINEGDPRCESLVDASIAVFSNGRAGCVPLAQTLSRFQYAKPALSNRQAPLSQQVLNYFQYFDWQWGRGLASSETPGNARLPATIFFMVLIAAGFFYTWRSDREVFAYLLVLAGTLSVGLVFYLNFKYGYSLAPEVTDRSLHEVRERDYFFVGSFGLFGVLAGIGLAGLWADFVRRVRRNTAVLATGMMLAMALIPLVGNWGWASRNGDYAARDWAFNLLESVEPYGVLFTNGDNDTFPLWYIQEVEGLRRDVTVVVLQYLYTGWYPKQLQELTVPARQRPFQKGASSLYAVPTELPSDPIIRLSPETMDRISSGRIPEDFTVPLGEVALSYRAGTFLDRGQRLALSIIHDSLGERPIYFASTAGLMRGLGVHPWGIRQGLVTKLAIRDLDDDPDMGALLTKAPPALGGEWFDMDRSLSLVSDVYTYRGLRDRKVWVDRSTLNIPGQFYIMSRQLAGTAELSGADPAIVTRLRNDAAAFQITAQGGTRGGS